jgi:hypothetical protein
VAQKSRVPTKREVGDAVNALLTESSVKSYRSRATVALKTFGAVFIVSEAPSIEARAIERVRMETLKAEFSVAKADIAKTIGVILLGQKVSLPQQIGMNIFLNGVFTLVLLAVVVALKKAGLDILELAK